MVKVITEIQVEDKIAGENSRRAIDSKQKD